LATILEKPLAQWKLKVEGQAILPAMDQKKKLPTEDN